MICKLGTISASSLSSLQRLPKGKGQVEIDSRFASVFTNKDFAPEFSVDKRGRQMKKKSGENLARYYRLEGGDRKENTENSDRKQIQNVQPSAPKAMAKKQLKGKLAKNLKVEVSSGAALVVHSDGEEEGVPHKGRRGKHRALISKPPLEKEEEEEEKGEEEEEEEDEGEEGEEGGEVGYASSSSSSDDDSDDGAVEEEEEVWWATRLGP